MTRHDLTIAVAAAQRTGVVDLESFERVVAELLCAWDEIHELKALLAMAQGFATETLGEALAMLECGPNLRRGPGPYYEEIPF